MIYRLAVCVLLPCVAALSSPVAPGLQRTCVSRLPASRVSPRAAVLLCAEAAPEEATEVAADAAAEEASKKGKKGNRTPIADLEEGAEIQGTVRSVMAYGAFVDIGASTDGLLHVSEIANEYVKDANDKLSAGDAVTVRIKSVNVDKNQVALTAKDPNAAPAPRGGGGGGRKARADLSKYADADEKEFVAGTVSSIADFGAFVTLEEGVDGLLHISQIAEGGVSSVGDVLSVGQEVQVRVTSVDVGSRRIGLSMKPWTDAPPPEKRGGGGGRGKGGGGKRMSREEQEEAELKLSPEEIAELEGDDDTPAPSAFESAFARAALVQQAKAEGGRYEKQVL